MSLAETSLVVAPGRQKRTVVHEGQVVPVPAGWELLPPGDAGLTRRVKAGGPSWTEKEKRGRRVFSQGVWAPAERIAAARAAIENKRADPAYQRRLDADRGRRERAQAEYVVEFELHVRRFLDFDPRFAELEKQLAKAIAEHATPVGSGTVARTSRIPVERRAEAAVIAWLRHQTTAYDHMRIARVKGRRREVRRELAQASRALLAGYRRGDEPATGCPLKHALDGGDSRSAPRLAPPSPAPKRQAPEAEPTAKPKPKPNEPKAAPTDREAEQRALYEQVRARLMRGR